MSRSFEVLRSGEELAGLEAEWTDLLARSESDTVFLTWEWLRTWWEVYGPLGRLLFVTARENGRLVAGAPFCVVEGERAGFWKPRELRLLGTVEVCSDFVDVVVDSEAEPSLRRKLLHFVRTSLASEWDVAHLDSVPLDSPTVAAIAREFGRGPLRPAVEIGPRCPYLPLPGTFDALLMHLEPGFRKALRTASRKIAAKGELTFRVLNAGEPSDAAFGTFVELHERRWGAKGEPGVFRSSRFREFHSRIARRFHARGWLFLATLAVDGAPVAARYGFLYRGRLFDYQGGFDPDWSKWSVGLVLYGACLKEEIARGAVEHDFLRGQNLTKARWTSLDRVNARIRFGKADLFQAVVEGSEFARRRVGPLLRGVLPEWAVGTLRRVRDGRRTASAAGSGDGS